MSRRFLLLIGAAVVCAYAGLLAAPASAGLPGLKDQKAATEEQIRIMEEKARGALKAREWIVYLTAKNAKSASETDVYVFTDGTMESKGLLARGYPVSNITVTVGNDGSVVWETMKTTAAKDKAFYRGELRDGVMTGAMVMKSSKGQVSTFSFSSAAAQAPVMKQSIVETKEPVVETKEPVEKKKKK